MTNRQNLWLALTMAIKSLMAHRVKTVIVGSLLVLGTVLVTCGIALLDNVEQSISRSVIESLAGHLQIYDAHAQDKLAIYGDGSGGMPNVGEIESFKALLDSVEDFDNVDALIPMGVNIASMNRGNALERRLATWRKEMGTESLSARRLRITQVKDLLAELKSELTNQIELTDEIRRQELKAPLDHINSTESEDFWSRCLEDPTDALELIDTQIAPFAGNGRVLYLRYVGTDFKRFHRYFARFKLVEGRLIPPGERGMLINQTFADARLKLLPARLLDKLAESANEDVRIEDSLDLKSQARRLLTQVKSVTRLLPPESVQPTSSVRCLTVRPILMPC